MRSAVLDRFRAALWGARAEHASAAGDARQAEAWIRLALAIASPLDASVDPLRLQLWNARGMIAKSRGRLAAAARAYRQARALLAIRPDADARAALLHNLAGLEHARRRFARGEILARRGLAIRTRLRGERHRDVASDLAALAAILDGRGRHAEAECLHRRALAIFSHGIVPDRRECAAVLANLAACLFSQRRIREAEACGVRAVDWRRRGLGADHPETRVAVRNLEVIRTTGEAENALGQHRSSSIAG